MGQHFKTTPDTWPAPKAASGGKGPRTKRQMRRLQQRRIVEREEEKYGLFTGLFREDRDNA